mgnify:CR=1 FL=1
MKIGVEFTQYQSLAGRDEIKKINKQQPCSQQSHNTAQQRQKEQNQRPQP